MITRLLVANRGEIAVRILATAADLGIETVAVAPVDDADAQHVRRADHYVELPGAGPAAYLDIEAVVAAATETGATAVHPGYGFLAENASFARACADAGLVFVGPTPDSLELFGDKAQARSHAQACEVPVAQGLTGPADAAAARGFLEGLGAGGAVMVKAVAGGGGRGMRVATNLQELDEAWSRASSEAQTAFGNGDLYVEELIADARHVEVQIVGDGAGGVVVLGDRECSVQRGRQKLVEIAPAPALHERLRERLHEAAQRLGKQCNYLSLGTMEFLVTNASSDDARFVFIEGNARIQVEHTVTEEIFGVDLVAVQLELASGNTDVLATLPSTSRGASVQVRINAERPTSEGLFLPTGGLVSVYEPPTGPGIRVDSYLRAGYTTNPRYDSLVAKLIASTSAGDVSQALQRAHRALGALHLEGIETTARLGRAIVARPEVSNGTATTTWLETHLADLLATAAASAHEHDTSGVAGEAGAHVNTDDPLAVLAHGRDALITEPVSALGSTSGDGVTAPLQGTVLSIDVAVGDQVAAGQQVAIMEAMKMEHVISAAISGTVISIGAAVGTAVLEGHTLVGIAPGEVDSEVVDQDLDVDLDHVRPDLAEVIERHDVGLDHRRPNSVERRRRTGQRTARENLEDLVDDGSFIEYGPLVIAAQRRRRSVEDLVENTPADGMIAGIGRVNGHLFGEDASRCVVTNYDYTVLAGTQGNQNHRKKDRVFELARDWQIPIVLFTEGGGGRPGDTDGVGVAGLDCLAFGLLGELSGLVPIVGINSGYCFAGNAALLGCCDVIIATENSNIGMGGPAMIEGGGLGVFRPTEVGPMSVQRPNGVVDIAVSDEAEAVAVAKTYLSYFQGRTTDWESGDQRLLRHLVPENRLRVYEVRDVIDALFDVDSVLELRKDFGVGIVTSLARIEGRPVGVLANNPKHLGGAIDADAADKAARFMQLCDAYDLPIVNLCDTPGFMVGPEVERTAQVRHVSRMFVTGRSITVPSCTIVLRKGYGLGAQAMAAGGFKFPMFTVSWPTGEFGGMGLEGAVKLGYRKELEAIEDPDERKALYDELVERMYTVGKGVSMADHFEIDDVIDPADSRHWITTAFGSTPPPPPRQGKKRPMIDTW